MSLKLQAWQGLLVVLVILGVLGGSLQLIATGLQQDPSLTYWMGSYQAPFLAFLENSWLIIVVTFIYNIFMYFRQHQLAALKQTIEFFQIQKFNATLAWFIAILGPMVALVTNQEFKAIGSFIVLFATALMKEFENIRSNQTILPPTTSGSPSASTTSTQSTTSTPSIPTTPTAADTTVAGPSQPLTPSGIPPIPPLPATVLINGIVTVEAVSVDGQSIPASATPGTLKAGQWTSVTSGSQTILSIAFPDYLAHVVSINYDGTSIKLNLTSGAIWPPA